MAGTGGWGMSWGATFWTPKGVLLRGREGEGGSYIEAAAVVDSDVGGRGGAWVGSGVGYGYGVRGGGGLRLGLGGRVRGGGGLRLG